MWTQRDFTKIFQDARDHRVAALKKWQRYFRRKARDDDRQLDVANLSDEELDRLKDQLPASASAPTFFSVSPTAEVIRLVYRPA